MPLSQQQIERFRQVVGDVGAETFTTGDLQQFFTDASENFDLAVVYALDALIGNAATLTDYKQGESEEKRSQVLSNLLKIRGVWKDRVNEGGEGATATTQVLWAGLDVKVHRRKDKPRA